MKFTFWFSRRKNDLVSRPLLSADESKLSEISYKDQKQSAAKNKSCLSIDETKSTSFCDDQSDESSSVSVSSPTDETQQTILSSSSSSQSVDNESWRQHGHEVRLNILEEELRNPKCDSFNPALPLERCFDLGKKIFDTFTTTLRRSSDDSQLLLNIYLEAFVYAHRFHKLHSNVVFNHPMFYSQFQVHKCLRSEHLSRLNFILSCIDELSERIDLLVYNETFGTNEAAEVFKITLHRTSPWSENGKDITQTQQVELDEMTESNELLGDDEQIKEQEGENKNAEDDLSNPFEPRDVQFFNLKEAVDLEHNGSEDIDSDKDSDFNSPILKAEFEPYAGESLSNFVQTFTSPKLTQPISEPTHDTPTRARRVRFTLTETSQTLSEEVGQGQTSPLVTADGYELQVGKIMEPPQVKRVNHNVSSSYARLLNKFEAMNSPSSCSQPVISQPQATVAYSNDESPRNVQTKIETKQGYHVTPSIEDTAGFPSLSTFTGSEEDLVSSSSEALPTGTYRTPTRALRTYRDCAETLKAMTHRSPSSTITPIPNSSGKPEEKERNIIVSSSFNNYGSADESFDEVSFSGGRHYKTKEVVPHHIAYDDEQSKRANEILHVPLALKSSGRYKNLPNYILSNS